MRKLLFAAFGCVLATVAVAQTPVDPTDPAHMSRAALQAEVAASRAMISNGGVNADRPSGCTAVENHQLDFWLGEWDITTTGDLAVIGEATITSYDQGCALLEDFRPFNGGHGTGLFGYDSLNHRWRQTFIDASGAYATAQGEFENGVVSFEIHEPPPPSRFPRDMQRMIRFQQIDANTVHQWGERMDPTAHAWVKFLDLTYHRRGTAR